MSSESEHKLLARPFLEEVVNTGAVERLSDFLRLVRWAHDLGPAIPTAKGASPNGAPTV